LFGGIILWPQSIIHLEWHYYLALPTRRKQEKFLIVLGFQSNGNGDEKPEYLTDEQWELFKQKSLIGRLDYQYYIAFYYLKSLTNFRTVTSGKLVRRAMKEYEA
jgi:hypothetical protein